MKLKSVREAFECLIIEGKPLFS